MKRKGLFALFGGIYVTLVLAMLFPMGACEAAPLTKVRWNLNVHGSPRQFTAGVDKFVALIAERTKGNFVIETRYGAPLSPPRENLDALKAGAFEAGVILPSYHPGKTPLWNATALPFMKDVEDPYVCGYMGMKLYEEFEAAKKELAVFNVRFIYPLGQSPTVAIGNKALRKVEDFKGVRFRALGLHNDAVKAMGATPMTVPAPEVFEALDKKVIDIAAMNASSLVMGYNLHEISKYLHTWPLGVTLGMLICNEDAYRSLPKEYQKVMDEAWEDALLWHRTSRILWGGRMPLAG